MIQEKLLTPNMFSRPGKTVTFDNGPVTQQVEGIVMHWVQNPGALNHVHRNWWEGRKTGDNGYGSAHYVIDKENGIWQCVPDDEIAYHVGAGSFPGSGRYTQYAEDNFDAYPSARTIGVELCHPTIAGWFEPEVLAWAKWLVAGLCIKYRLNPIKRIHRHFDITGKQCPEWWVKNPDEFRRFKFRVDAIVYSTSNS